MDGKEKGEFSERLLHEGKELKAMRNNLIVAGNGLSGSAHPGTDSCAVRGGCVVVRVFRDMRSKALMHAPHDEEEHQTEGNCETFSICHIIADQKHLKSHEGKDALC